MHTVTSEQLSSHPNRLELPLGHPHASMEHAGTYHGQFELHCGNWMHGYAQLHRSIRAGSNPPRYAMVKPCSGLADNLACMGSAFYLALLTGRAFVIDETDEEDRFSYMYHSRYIDWKSSLQDIEQLSNFSLGLVTGFGPLEGEVFDTFRQGDINSLGKDADVIYLQYCNAGVLYLLFDNPLYKQRLYDMGLRPETAFGCMHNFLFEILPAVKDKFLGETAIMEDHNNIKIGIQIRTGDDTMMNQTLDDPTLDEAEAVVGAHASIFQCAETIEKKIVAASNKRVVWFLLTDSVNLRKSAVLKFGSKVLTNIQGSNNLKHIRKDRGGGGAAAMMYAAGEHWLFSLADYHVFEFGGYGKTAAIVSLKWGFYSVGYHGCKPVSVHELALIAPYIK